LPALEIFAIIYGFPEACDVPGKRRKVPTKATEVRTGHFMGCAASDGRCGCMAEKLHAYH
jgi:hypothetical protein